MRVFGRQCFYEAMFFSEPSCFTAFYVFYYILFVFYQVGIFTKHQFLHLNMLFIKWDMFFITILWLHAYVFYSVFYSGFISGFILDAKVFYWCFLGLP